MAAMNRIRTQLSVVAERLRSSLWTIPSLGVLAGAVGALLLARLGDAGAWVLPVFVGSPDSARSVLSVIAGSTMTVTSLTFSLTVVALQVASGQFTPRLMRSFLSDRGNKVVLSIFLGTFTLSLLLLQAVQGESADLALHVPTLGVTVAIIAAMASIIALVYFIHHLTQQLRIDRVIDKVANDTIHIVKHQFQPAIVDEESPDPSLPDDAVAIPTPRSGHVNDIAVDDLLEAAAAAGLSLHLRPVIGAYAVKGTTLAWAWSRSGELDVEAAKDMVVDNVRMGRDRTLTHDASFGVRQLVDIGVRALSPGINDPTTAVETVQQITRILRELARHDVGTLLRKRNGQVLVVPRLDFGAHLSLAVDQILRYGAGDPQVLRALAVLLRDVAEGLDGQMRKEATADKIDEVEQVTRGQGFREHELEPVLDALEVAREVLAGIPADTRPAAS